MPPKKKKDSKKSGKKKSGKKNEKAISATDIQIDEPELNKDFFILHIKDLERKLRLYKEKAETFQTVNDTYMKKQKELSQEKHYSVSLLEKNLFSLGDEFSDLKDRYFGLQQAKEAEKNKYESTLQEIRSKLQESKDQLTSEISIISAKLAALDEFKVQKDKQLEEYRQLEQVLVNKKTEHQMMLDSIQDKESHDHDRLKKEIVTRINMVAADFRRISQKQTSETTKRTIRENVSIRTQLAKMDDKNIEMMQENDQLRQKVKSSVNRIKELEKICTDLASKNLSHTKLLHLLMMKHEEHQEIIQSYQAETNIIQKIEEENENIKMEMVNRKDQMKILENSNKIYKDEIYELKQQLEEINYQTDQARKALIEAVHHLQELLQFIPSTTSSGSAKSTHTSMSKRTASNMSATNLSAADRKEWGDFHQRAIAEEKLRQLLDALDYDDYSSRVSSVNDNRVKSGVSVETEMKRSSSMSITSKNASAIKRLSPVLKDEVQTKPKLKIKILSDFEIRQQAKLHAIQEKKGFCVPGVLQMVPHMYKHIPTNLEKTQFLNKRLNGLDAYASADEIEKPIKSNVLKPLDDSKIRLWSNKLSS